MNHHQYQQIPPHGPYIPPQMMGPPHHQHHHHHPSHSYQPYPQPSHGINNMGPYSQHPPHPPSHTTDFRAPHFHQPNRPLIVSTPSSHIHQYQQHVIPHPIPNPFYRPTQMHPGIQPYYPPQETPQLPPDIPSPASMPQETPASNPESSPTRSVEAIEEPGEARYETPITSSSSVLPSPMVPHFLPLPSGTLFQPPQLPWYSAPNQSFPIKKARMSKRVSSSHDRRQRISHLIDSDTQDTTGAEDTVYLPGSSAPHPIEHRTVDRQNSDFPSKPRDPDTTIALPLPSNTAIDSPHHQISRPVPRPSVPIPVVPFIPAIHKPRKSADIANPPILTDKPSDSPTGPTDTPCSVENSEAQNKTEPTRTNSLPKSWADLVRSKSLNTPTTLNTPVHNSTNGIPSLSGNPGDNPNRTLADVLNSFAIPKKGTSHSDWVPLVEPRGLINTGNMCFMNSILQALLFCGPFLVFLDCIGRNVAHNFKSDTPLIDAMILFMREFRRIQPNPDPKKERPGLDGAVGGDPFVPEYVYEAVRGLKRFSSMRRGHQQDAEEFLNFFLDVLHEECVAAMKSDHTSLQRSTNASMREASVPDEETAGWLEVGHKQKTAITRSVGHISGISPVTKIFGGQMRSELRVSGQRSSVMREPYQSLQLDIQSNDVNDVVDAIRHISIPEQLQGGDFKSARGASVSATKQAFIDSLPPVLILHLKRFQYNNTGGTQKIWKGIGYPLELEIPNEVLSPASRAAQKPRYKLISVVYHHGKSATNGHYTVDVRMQDGWVRIDDTIVKRIQESDILADAGPQPRELRKKDVAQENGWKDVSVAAKAGPKSINASNSSAKEDKVAYLLFYELQ